MSIRAVTFDCAQTLIAVDWRAAVLAVQSARDTGLNFDQSSAAVKYDTILRDRWNDFREINLSRDPAAADAFWYSVCQDWAAECGFPDSSVAGIVAAAESRLYGECSTVFALYDDVVPCLESLQSAGIKMGIVSNWDVSLHRTLERFGLAGYFDTVVASMEEGVEKPDPRIFEIALKRLGVDASEALHVGDNPMDDLRGARTAGMRAFVVDRGPHAPGEIYLNSLLELPGRLGI